MVPKIFPIYDNANTYCDQVEITFCPNYNDDPTQVMITVTQPTRKFLIDKAYLKQLANTFEKLGNDVDFSVEVNGLIAFAACNVGNTPAIRIAWLDADERRVCMNPKAFIRAAELACI